MEKKFSTNKLVPIIILIFIYTAISFVAFSFTFYTIVKQFAGKQSENDYNMTGDYIPTIDYVVGHREVTKEINSKKNEISKKLFTYASFYTEQDVLDYVDYLLYYDEFLLYTELYDYDLPSGFFELAKPSVDDGMMILVQIDYSFQSFTIQITKCKSDIDIIEEKPQDAI